MVGSDISMVERVSFLYLILFFNFDDADVEMVRGINNSPTIFYRNSIELIIKVIPLNLNFSNICRNLTI